MKVSSFTSRFTREMTLFIIAGVTLVSLLMAGCVKTLDGQLESNNRPVVEFVNIPPDGQQFSRNPTVFWYGTDIDGIVAFYRYHVITRATLGSQTPEQYIANVDSSAWVYLEVDPTGNGSQQTEVTIKLVADPNDPVRSFVEQYIFIQAVDDENGMSDVKYRLYSRNDNPPITLLFGGVSGTPTSPFVNAPIPGGLITGVKFTWQGSDPIDYPADPPPFEFEWRLYGPYADSTVTKITNQFRVTKFVSREGLVYDLGDTLINCDTTITIAPPDTTIDCDTVTVSLANRTRINQIFGADFGVFDTIIDVNAAGFLASAEFNKVVDSSFDGDTWVLNTSDTIYNVFKSESFSTTTQRQFMFWIRTRDDAQVPDLTAEFRFVSVIDPKFERDVLVIDLTSRSAFGDLNHVTLSAARRYFRQALRAWKPTIDFIDTFNVTTGVGDYIRRGQVPAFGEGTVPLSWTLNHKLIILYNDDIGNPLLTSRSSRMISLFTAIDGGVNAWVMARNAMLTENPNPNLEPNFTLTPSNPSYVQYFGAVRSTYSGWICHAYVPGQGEASRCQPQNTRIEDFIGALSLDSSILPNLRLDTAKFNDTNTFIWTRFPLDLPYFADAGIDALPEVNWSSRLIPGTEALFLYQSLYGNEHFLGGFYNMQGRPVGHRYNTGFYRTVHFNFTPVLLDSASMQVVFNAMMDWLLEQGTLNSDGLRYPDAPRPLNRDDLRRAAALREEEANEEYFRENPELRVTF